MSDDLAWKDIAAQLGELIRIACGQVLHLLRNKFLVTLVLACTFAISYETLYQLAHGENYHSLPFVAFLFPLQLDTAALPGIALALAPGVPRWVRVLGIGEALFGAGASLFGNLAEMFDWAHAGPGLVVATTIFRAALSPVMGIFCVVIAHLPAGTAPKKVVREIPVKTELKPELKVAELPTLKMRDGSMTAAREYAVEFLERYERWPAPAEAIASLPPELRKKARADNNIGKAIRDERRKRAEVSA